MKLLRDVLKETPVALGFSNMYPAPGIVERLARHFDWVWIDTQHGQHDYDSVINTVRVADLTGICSIVRVPANDYGWIGRVLDTGAGGVLVPMVNSAEEARAAVKAAKFAPLGQRSYGTRRIIDVHGRGYSHTANEDIVLICQIESLEAIGCCDEIAAVPGVDALFLGPDDMSVSQGMRMDKPRPKGHFDKELTRMAEACKANGKIASGVAPTPETLRHMMDLGYNLLACCGDSGLLTAAAEPLATAMREVIAEKR